MLNDFHRDSDRNNIRNVNFYGRGLLNDAHAEDQPVALVFSQQDTLKALKRPPDDLDLHPFLQIGMRVIGQHAGHQRLNGGDFLIWNRLGALPSPDDIHDTDRLERGHPLIGVQPDEAITREQGHLHLFFSVLPLAETLHGRQQRLHTLMHELVAHDLLMP